jgi:hypothetical protein
MLKRFSLILVVLLFGTVVLSACGAPSAEHAKMAMAPVSTLPEEMQKAPATVRESYQFAVANPEPLENVPCYCGCGSIGHTSNLDCYVKEFGADGKPVFDTHALGCSLCVDIAQDVMKMTAEGKEPTAIRVAVLDAYSKFGPTNQ